MCERRQIDMGIRHSHLDAGRPFKHPGRNLQPTVRIGTAQAAAKNTVTRPLDRRVNADPKTKPRMPWVQQFSKLGSVGVLKLCCTMRSGRMRGSAISLRVRSIGPPRDLIRRVCPTSPIPITGKSAWYVRPEKSSGAASDCSSTKCWPGNRLVSKNMTAAPGSCTSVLSCSAASIMPVNSNDRLSRGVGAARCARQRLRAPRLRADDVLPIERSKLLPIVPATQSGKRVGVRAA